MKIETFCAGALQTNCALLYDERDCIAVDAPYGMEQVISFITRKKLRLRALLLTHGHFDHVGGAQQLLRACGNADIYLHEGDFRLAANAARNRWNVPCENCAATQKLREGTLCVGGFRLEVLETPFHTAGSVCFIADDVLFAGDTLFKNGIGRSDFPESVPHKMQSSLQKLRALDKNYFVLCGHGENTDLNREKQFNPYLR